MYKSLGKNGFTLTLAFSLFGGVACGQAGLSVGLFGGVPFASQAFAANRIDKVDVGLKILRQTEKRLYYGIVADYLHYNEIGKQHPIRNDEISFVNAAAAVGLRFKLSDRFDFCTALTAGYNHGKLEERITSGNSHAWEVDALSLGFDASLNYKIAERLSVSIGVLGRSNAFDSFNVNGDKNPAFIFYYSPDHLIPNASVNFHFARAEQSNDK